MLKTMMAIAFLLSFASAAPAMAKRSMLDCLPGQGNLQTTWRPDGGVTVSCETRAKVGKQRARKAKRT